MIYGRIEDTIGNTPLLKLDATRYGILHTDIYVKLEYLNPFGSIKDRTAQALLAAQLHDEKPTQQAIIESSSGNTAKALQMLAGRKNINLTSVTNRIKIPEIEHLLRYIGTSIVSLPGKSECPDPNDADNAINTIERMMQEKPGYYMHTSQYSNRANTQAHRTTTAQEMYDDLGYIDYIVTGVGTGGSSGGLIEYALQHHKSTQHVGVVAHPSDFLPGIRTKNELFETALFHENAFTDICEVTSRDALDALRRLVVEEGVMAGPTTGANFAVTLEYVRARDELRADGSKRTAVFVACDRLESYMSYIIKRQPDLFDIDTHNDIFTLVVEDDDATTLSRTADASLVEWLAATPVLVIDTRGVKPYNNFHIAGSMNYPEELLREVLTTGTPFAYQPILFVCPTGNRSTILAKVLRTRGYEAYSLDGGLMSWRAAHLPFERTHATH